MTACLIFIIIALVYIAAILTSIDDTLDDILTETEKMSKNDDDFSVDFSQERW